MRAKMSRRRSRRNFRRGTKSSSVNNYSPMRGGIRL